MTWEDFPSFFRALNDYEPFPWQSRLAQFVVKDGKWPSIIAMPTASGKTAVLDIAIFALAAEADMAGPERRAPRRIFYIVDRRIIVDEVFDRARKIASKLAASSHHGDGILRRVADRLMRFGGQSALEVSVMRGGMYRGSGWTRSPLQPVVCVSTVDQVGSRLLFRGYGLGNGNCNLLPIHAGLLANDALLILDEAHLSQPFMETLASLKRYREWTQTPAPTPWEFVQMTATPRDGVEAFTADVDDFAQAILAKRLEVPKTTVLVEVNTEHASAQHKREVEARNTDLLVNEMCGRARELSDKSALGKVIAVIFNRVASARDAFNRLSVEVDAEAILLTGRTRPYDRDRLIEKYQHRFKAGRIRDGGKSLYVIATQCIEVGADFDFDALVTECAALDALRQRFGRLDRLGNLGDSRAVIVARRDQLKEADDPVYGCALARTWEWLAEIAGKPKGKKKTAALVVDFGVRALDELIKGNPAPSDAYSPDRHAPVMLPAHLDLWVQTSPIPVPDPDVAVFLHGPETQLADVQVVWRADIDPAVQDADTIVAIVSMLPPSSLESLPVPFVAARSWLASLPPPEISDVEGMRNEHRENPNDTHSQRRALGWRGRDHSALITAADLRPGDTIVVPSYYGGADQFGWNPISDYPVRDIGDLAAARRGIATLRLHSELLKEWIRFDPGRSAVLLAALKQLLNSLTSDDAGNPREMLSDLLEKLVDVEQLPGEIGSLAKALLQDGRPPMLYPDETGVAVLGGRKARAFLRPVRDRDEDSQLEFTDEDDNSSLIRRQVTLQDHSAGVKSFSHHFAAGLPSDLSADIELAAWLHDIGKADPRFQLMLHGGDEFNLAKAELPLAKSGMDPTDPLYRQARRLSCCTQAIVLSRWWSP
jgi:CRISPR-associated endonuclease/helicase Cas3